MNKNEILLLLTERWCDWEASYAIAVANSFSEYHVKTIGVDKTDKVSMGGIRAAVDFSIDDYDNFNDLSILIIPGGLSWEEKFQNVKKYKGEKLYIPTQIVYDQGVITANETAAVEFAYEIFKILKVDSDEEIDHWFDNFQYGAVR